MPPYKTLNNVFTKIFSTTLIINAIVINLAINNKCYTNIFQMCTLVIDMNPYFFIYNAFIFCALTMKIE